MLVEDKPTVVCLCGSTRFGDLFAEASLVETLKGRIVLSIGCNLRSDAELFDYLSLEQLVQTKAMLDELHLRKIDLSDEVLILNKNGYFGESTQNELSYAMRQGKRVRFFDEKRAPKVS